MTTTTLLILLFTAHFLADYTHLSTNWMLSAKRFGEPLLPILCHALVHGVLMGIVLIYLPYLLWIKLILFQVITHFIIDVLKGKVNKYFPTVQSPANKIHWIVFGFDQLLHAIVIILMVHGIHETLMPNLQHFN